MGFERLAASSSSPLNSGLNGFEYIAAENGNKQEESWLKNLGRKAYQVAGGIINATPIPLAADLMSNIATGESLGELEELKERLPELKKKFPQIKFPDEINEEKYMQNLGEAQKSFPTQRNIERGIEELTGLPLEAKTRSDELLRLGGMGGKLASASGKTNSGSVAAGIATPVAAEGLKAVGVPEPVADMAALVLSNPLASTYEASPSIVASKKASGLTNRRYELNTKPKEVSAKTKQNIVKKTEGEFRNITDKLIKEGEGAKTYQALKDDVTFKSNVADLFKDVEKLSTEFVDPISTQSLKKNMINAKPEKGFVSSEYDKAYNSLIKKQVKDIKAKDVSAQQLVQQYRKNNAQLAEYFDPSKSKAINRAKKDALIDFNQSISKTIKEQFPNSEFSKLFEFTNKRWSQIKDAEFIDKFMDDLFKGEIKYEKGKSFLQSENSQLPFKRILGEKGFQSFQSLIKDLMSTENANKLLKVADKKGLGDFANYALKFVLNPTLLKAKIGSDIVKGGWEKLLDKPQLAFEWKKGIKEFKSGNFEASAKTFEDLFK